MKDPVAAVKNIKNYFGLELSAQGEQSLRDWQTHNPQHKHGKHVYSRASEDVGLTSDEIRSHFSHYMNHYGLSAEER